MEALLAALVRGEQVDWPFTGAAAEQQFLDAAQRHGVVPLVAWQQRRLRISERLAGDAARAPLRRARDSTRSSSSFSVPS